MPESHGAAQWRLTGTPPEGRALTGFGSFGKPAVLIERLARILAHFGDDGPTGRGLSDGFPHCRPPGALMDHLSLPLCAPARHSAAIRNRMAGFFLYREGGRIRIRVLTPDGWSHIL